MVRWLVVNEHEAQLMAEGATDPRRAAETLLRRGVGCVVVTLGAMGALLADGNAVREIDPYSVTAVDSTGSGDAFVGALAVALAAGLPADAAVRLGNASGAAAATALSAQQGLPRPKDLRRLFGIDLHSLLGGTQ